MKVQLLYFSGCPHVEAARTALREALAAEKIDLPVEEVDVEAPEAPASVRGWGSPTILVDGEDVMGQVPANATCCRLYADGAPDVAAIRRRLRAARR